MLLLATCFSRSGSHALTLSCGLLLATGCQEKKPTASGPPVARPRPAPAPPAAPAPAKTAKTACSLVDDEVAEDPFGAEITVADLQQDGATIVSRKPFKNRHERNQVDTILILRHHGNQFEFYRAAEKDLLREVTVTDFAPQYGQQLQQKLGSAYRARYARQTGNCDSLRIGDSNRLNTVAMTLHKGQLSAVQVQYYVD
ncbi:hypothetical protein H8B15_20510 [Hymenobacter sp. BT507]|uniref:Lipoprotein n=1 Tax=Hymenobacter citatus TaxID=2763506 RepID=A0ABR7MRE3_9BACT|nr:hypothetical protein [Hymenobacter citatus]MBC6613315.1 hypothetical protein [Hymenobacter citatus]